MTPRSIRRAAERKANKRARKAAQNLASTGLVPVENQFPFEEMQENTPESITEAPVKTSAPVMVPPAAAANTNLTAVRSAVTGYATLLPTTDAAQYTRLLHEYETAYQPASLEESNMVESLAETTWRARRALALEMAIYAKGRIEFAEQFAEHKPELRESLIDLHTFLTYEKQIRGLQSQEARLTRRADKLTAELRSLQKERRELEEKQQRQLEAAPKKREIGSEFSNHEMALNFTQKQPRNLPLSASPTPHRAEAA